MTQSHNLRGKYFILTIDHVTCTVPIDYNIVMCSLPDIYMLRENMYLYIMFSYTFVICRASPAPEENVSQFSDGTKSQLER